MREARAEILSLQVKLQKKDDLLSKLTWKSEEVLRLGNMCKDLQAQQENLQKELQQATYDRTVHTQGDVESLRTELEKLEADYTCVVSEMTVIKAHNAELEAASVENACVHDSIEDLEFKVLRLSDENMRLSSEVTSLKSDIVDLKVSNAEFQKEAEEKQSENDRMRNKINDQQGEIVDLKSQLDLLDDENFLMSSEVVKRIIESKEATFASQLDAKVDEIIALKTEHQKQKDTIEKLNEEIQMFKNEFQKETRETAMCTEDVNVIKTDSSTAPFNLNATQDQNILEIEGAMRQLNPEQDVFEHYFQSVDQAFVDEGAVLTIHSHHDQNSKLVDEEDTNNGVLDVSSYGQGVSLSDLAQDDPSGEKTVQCSEKTLPEKVQILIVKLRKARAELDEKEKTLKELASEKDHLRLQLENMNRVQEEVNQLQSNQELQISQFDEEKKNLQNMVDMLTANIEELKLQNSQLSAEKTSDDSIVETLLTEKCSLQESIVLLKTEVENIKSESVYLTAKLKSDEEEHEKYLNQLNEECKRLRQENENILLCREELLKHNKEEVNSLTTEVNALNKELVNIKADLENSLLEKHKSTEEIQMLKETSHSEIHCLKAELEQARQEIQRTVTEEQQQKSSTEVELENVFEELTKLRTELSKSEARIFNEQNFRNQCETKNTNLSEKIARLHTESEETKTVIQNLELDKTKLEDDLSKANADIQKITSDCQSIKGNFECQNHHLMEEIQQHETSIEQLRTELDNAKTVEKELRKSLQMQQENSQEESSRLHIEVNQARINLEQLEENSKQDAESYDAQLCASSAEIKQLKEELAQGRLEFDDLQTNYASLQEEYQEFQLQTQQQIDTLKSSVDHANEETEQIVAHSEQKRASLEASLAAANEEVEQLKKEAAKAKSVFESQLLSNSEELMEMQRKLENVEKEYECTMDDLNAELTIRDEVQHQSENLSCEVRNLQNQLDISKTEVSNLQTQLESLTEKAQNEQNAKEEIQNHCDALNEEFNGTIQERDDLQMMIDKYIEVLQDLNNRLGDGMDEINITTLDQGADVIESNLSRMKSELERLLNLVDDRNSNITELELTVAKKNEDMEIMTEYTNTLKGELTDVKVCLEEKSNEISNKELEVSHLKSNIENLHQEKEVLKINFDSCLEEMQSKIAEQEVELRNLVSQLSENKKSNDDGQDIKVAYERHVSNLEDKLEKAEAELEEVRQGFLSALDDKHNALTVAENQLSELEDTCNGLVNENARLKEQMEKTLEAFQREKCDLQKMHVTQMAELDDNCRTLEENNIRLQSQMCEQAKTFEQQQNELEMNYENQLGDIEDRCRILDMENGKLKHHLEEMAKDHKQEKEHLHNMYENQIIDLEDRCRENETKFGCSQQKLEERLFDSEQQRRGLEQQVQEVTDRCRELEHSRLLVQDRLVEVVDSSMQEKNDMENKIASAKQINEELKHELSNHGESQVQVQISEAAALANDAEDNSPNDAECGGLEESSDATTHQSQNNVFQNKTHAENVSSNTEHLEERIRLLSTENAKLKEAILETKKITQSRTLSRRGSFPTNDDIFLLRSTVSNLQTQITQLSQENDAIITDLQNEREKLNAAMETIEELKEGLRSARTVFDEMKADHQNELDQQKAESDREIEELREKLVAWEMELIQRRQLVDNSPSEQMIDGFMAPTCQSAALQLTSSEPIEGDNINSEIECGTGSKKAGELVKLVANYEQKVGDLSLELTRLHSEYQTSKHMHEAEVQDLRKKLDDHDEGDTLGDSASAFKRESDTTLSKIQLPSLQPQTISPRSFAEISGEFQPESVGTFEPELLTPEIDPNQNRFHLESELHQILPSTGDHISFSEDFEMDMELLVSPKKPTRHVPVNSQCVYRTEVGIQTDFYEVGHRGIENNTENYSFSPVSEGFKPEENMELSTEISVTSLSPTVKPIHLLENVIQPDAATQNESEIACSDELTQQDIDDATELVRRQLTHEKDVLEESYIRQLRMQEVEITQTYEAEKETLKKELEQRLQKKMSAIAVEKQQQFIKALRKVRKQLEARHEKQLEKIRLQTSKQSTDNTPMNEQDEIVHQLRQENQVCIIFLIHLHTFSFFLFENKCFYERMRDQEHLVLC